MASLVRITADDVHRLKAGQLQGLLNLLLHLEAKDSGIPLSSSQATDPARITVPDGGRDGFIQWRQGPEHTDFLPRRTVLFQAKAEEMPRSACTNEVLVEAVRAPKKKRGAKPSRKKAKTNRARSESPQTKPALKTEIARTFAEGGAYIIFCTERTEGAAHRSRVEGIREGLRIGGYKSWRKAPVAFYDANNIRDWVNKFPTAINWVLEQLRRGTWYHAKTWEQWAQDRTITSGRFVHDDTIRKRIEDLRALVSAPRSVSRLVGLSGLGKTRLAFETLSPGSGPDPAQKALSASVLYINAGEHEDRVLEIAEQLRVERWPVLLVVDDCRPQFHETLAQVVQNAESRFSLLTLDYDPVLRMTRYTVVKIDPVHDDVIRGILTDATRPVSAEEMDHLLRFSQGYPQLAVFLRDEALRGGARVSTLNDDLLLKRMIWGRDDPETEAQDVIRVCSIFTSLGYEDELEAELKSAAAMAGVTPAVFRRHVSRFQERGIIQQRGRYIRVLPLPVALRLAAEWWRGYSAADVKTLMTETKPALIESMCEQLRLLDTLPHARNIAAELCGINGPFSSAEVLNTETGSRCFRALAEVNPEAALDTLDRVLNVPDVNELKGFTSGRRNIVNALEQLVFHRNLFARAARLLANLALAETETWANNATGQFLQLFQPLLSGTEATLSERMSFLEEMVAAADTDTQMGVLAVKALDKALETMHYSRMGGAEEQGTKRLQDYRPTKKELRQYWIDAIQALTKIASAKNTLSTGAQQLLATNLRGLIIQGLLDEVTAAITTILPTLHNYWPQALDYLSQTLQFEGPTMPSDYRSRVEALRTQLLPTTFAGRMRLYVSELPYDLFGFDEKVFDTPEDPKISTAVALAEEAARDPARLFEVLPTLLRGEQRNIHPFAHRLGEIFPQFDRLIAESLEDLRAQPQPNPAFLGSFLAGLRARNQDAVTSTLDALANDDRLVQHLAYVTALAGVTDSDMARISSVIAQDRLPVIALRTFSYGRATDRLSEAFLERTLKGILDKGPEGAWTALDIASMYVHGHPERRQRLTNLFAEIISRPNVLQIPEEGGPRSLDIHHFEHAASALLDDEAIGPRIAKHLATEFVKVAQRKRFPYSIDHAIHPILIKMVAKYSETVWPIFAKAIEKENPLTSYHLGTALGSGTLRSDKTTPQPLSTFPQRLFTSWLESYPEGASFLLRYLNPLITEEDDSKTWHPYVRKLLDHAAVNEEALSELSANIWSFSWTGSVVNYYEQYLKPLEELLRHKRPLIKRWAHRQKSSIEKEIATALKRQEERQIGRF